jgi:hypothetical protein
VDDFAKLMKYMKNSIDKQIALKMPNPVSFGLLCEGKNHVTILIITNN